MDHPVNALAGSNAHGDWSLLLDRRYHGLLVGRQNHDLELLLARALDHGCDQVVGFDARLLVDGRVIAEGDLFAALQLAAQIIRRRRAVRFVVGVDVLTKRFAARVQCHCHQSWTAFTQHALLQQGLVTLHDLAPIASVRFIVAIIEGALAIHFQTAAQFVVLQLVGRAAIIQHDFQIERVILLVDF